MTSMSSKTLNVITVGYSEKNGLCSSTNTNFSAVKCFRIIRFVFSVSARGDELIVGISQQLQFI